jgi:hypothetical protein
MRAAARNVKPDMCYRRRDVRVVYGLSKCSFGDVAGAIAGITYAVDSCYLSRKREGQHGRQGHGRQDTRDFHSDVEVG